MISSLCGRQSDRGRGLGFDLVASSPIRSQKARSAGNLCLSVLVVNIGDRLDRLTGGRWRSTSHRVVNSGTVERNSWPLSSIDNAESGEYRIRFRWTPDAVAIWDNRATQHYPVADDWPSTRRMERVSQRQARVEFPTVFERNTVVV